MIFTENNYAYLGGSVNWQSGVAGRSKAVSRALEGEDFFSCVSKAARKVDEKNEDRSTDVFLKKHKNSSSVDGEASEEDRETSREALMRVISEQREEILRKLKNGDTSVKIPIGSMSLTEEEWEKLLKSFDKAQEEIQEAVREKSGEELPEKRPDTTINGNTVLAPEDTGHDLKSLEELISEMGIHGKGEEMRSAGIAKTGGFEDYLPGLQVITKVGNCNVSSGIWCRNDFPFWEYFKKGTSADALNDWQPSEPEPSQLDPKIQRNLHGIGPGKVSILIPEKLQEKMDADPVYADEIYRKVAKWKEDYDAWDNSVAASLGMDVMEHQFSKSYCLQLDEEGNVNNCTVVSSGGEITESKGTVEDNWIKRRNAAILFHKQHLARMGYTGITGTAGIIAQEGEESPLSMVRAALMAGSLMPEEKKKQEDL